MRERERERQTDRQTDTPPFLSHGEESACPSTKYKAFGKAAVSAGRRWETWEPEGEVGVMGTKKESPEERGGKKSCTALARWFSQLGCCPVHQKAVGLTPGQGTYLGCRFDPRDVVHASHQSLSPPPLFLSPSPPSFPLSLK